MVVEDLPPLKIWSSEGYITSYFLKSCFILTKKLKMENSMPRAFQWVISSSASSVLTIGEHNKKINMWRGGQWIIVLCMPPLFIAGTAGAANILYSKPLGGFPWWLPVIMLAGVYPAVVFLAMGHLTLFLPEAPFAAWEALYNVGYKEIGFVVAFTSSASLGFVDQPWVLITWACLQSALIAAVLAFWVCLVRTYGNHVAIGKKSSGLVVK
ncbi:unnamed protein product [Urochloa decumbens]|uniref:DUF7378 domain-containing protein n=1 Tax=Urochloa decumbens TaxID=240449 RepID=A0ABC9ACC8_9POAL